MNDAVNITLTENEAVQEETKVYSKADKIMAAVCAVLAFLFMELSVLNFKGFLTTALYIAIITAVIVYMKKKGCGFSKLNVAMATVLYLFSLVFSITDNDYIKSLDSFFLFCGGAYFVYSVGGGYCNIERYLPYAMKKALVEFPFSNYKTQLRVTKQCVKTEGVSGTIRNLILGLILAAPVTFVVAVLLGSADKGMEKLLSCLMDSDIVADAFSYIMHFLLSVPCSLYLFGMVYSGCHRDGLNVLDEDDCWKSLNSMRGIPNMMIYTSVTPICILYVIFFISQASYLLSAFFGSLPNGFTYAEYARRGFFELLTVTVINLGVICFISLFSKKCGEEKPKALKFYVTTLSSFTLVLIVVAMSKMIMYISEFGLTRLRLYTSWFMVLCAMIFVLIIIKQFRFRFRFAGWCTGVFTVMFALLCFARPDWVIAKYNMEMYSAGYLAELDTDSLLRLSDDAVLAIYDAGFVTKKEVLAHTHCCDDGIFQKLSLSSLELYNRMREPSADGGEIGGQYED